MNVLRDCYSNVLGVFSRSGKCDWPYNIIMREECGRPGPTHGCTIVVTPRIATFFRYIRVADIVHWAVTMNKDLRCIVVILGRRSSSHSDVIRVWGKEDDNKLQVNHTYV